MPSPSADVPARPAQPERALLGFIAAGRLTAFAWFADVAVNAPDVRARVALSRLAADQVEAYDAVARVAEQEGGPLADVVQDYLTMLDGVATRIRPADWWEDLIRSFVAGGMIADFAVLLGEQLDAPYRGAVVPAGQDQEDVVVAALRPAVDADSRLAARLALWGRRVAGEALGVVQPALAAMAGSAGLEGLDALVARALSEISADHARRMDRLGLAA